MADSISKTLDYDDHGVTQDFFHQVCGEVGVTPQVDRFANDKNAKVPIFYSAVFCPLTAGVDAFNFCWSPDKVNWIFPPMKLICRALYHLKLSKAAGLFLVPQWKNSYFYPLWMLERQYPSFKGVWVYAGPGMFTQGSDSSSFFGPHFKGNIEVWYLDFRLC